MKHLFYYFNYLIARSLAILLSLLPLSLVHALGRFLGNLAYFLHTPFRKKALSNLAIAYGEILSEKKRAEIARHSFQHLMITCLEFFILPSFKGNYDKLVSHYQTNSLIDFQEKKQGVVLFCGHQANWEIPFLALSEHYPGGVAIGRPIKNPYLYKWVLKVREINGAKIILPKNALKIGSQTLKKGGYIGIVGDQAYPNSSYSYPLFGRRAWTSTAPALLAYRNRAPLIVSTTKRTKNHYDVHLSKPIWPNLENSIKEEVPRMMNQALHFLEESIKKDPEQWMWIHDRWKQQGVDHTHRKYRFGSICVVFPKNFPSIEKAAECLKKIYPRAFFTFYLPEGKTLSFGEIHHYTHPSKLFVRDWRQQLLIDFSETPKLRAHYKKLGVMQALAFAPKPIEALKKELIKTIVKPECQKIVTT